MHAAPSPAEPHNVDEAGRVNRLHSVLSSVNEAIVRQRDPRELFETACRIAVEEGQFVMAWIGFSEPGSDRITPVARCGRDEGYLDSLKLSLNPDVREGQGPTAVALREGRTFVNNDTANNPVMVPWRAEQLARGYRSSVSLPLRVAGKTIGVLTLYAGRPDYFDAEELRLLECLADDFSFALESAQVAAEAAASAEALVASRNELETRVMAVSAAYEDLIGQRTEQALHAEALNRINARVHSTLDFDEIMSRAMLEITEALAVDAAVVQERVGDHWEFAYSYGLPEELRSPRLEDSDVPLAVEVARTREPIFVTDVARDERVNIRTMEAFGITALMAVPLIVRDEVFGVLVVDRFGEPAPFSATQLDFLQRAAATLSLGLENARLFEGQRIAQEQAKLELARTRLLQDVAIAASVGSSRVDVCDRALQAAATHWDLSVGAVYTYDAADGSLTLLTSLGLADDVIESSRRFDVRGDSSTLAVRAARERRAVASEDISATVARERLLLDSRLAGLEAIAVPLEAGGLLLGTVSFIFANRGPFSEAERDLMRSLAATIGQAFENARLLESEREARRQARIELAATQLLRSVAEAATTSMSLVQIAERALEAVARAVPMKLGGIYDYDDESKTLRQLAWRGPETLRESFREIAVTPDSTALVVRAMLSGDVVMTPDIASESERERVLGRIGIGPSESLAIPIQHQGQTLGSASFVFARTESFGSEEVELFRSLARILGQAIENARLYESTQEAARLGEALNVVNTSAHSSLELDEVMQHALDAGIDALDCDAGAVEIYERGEWVVRYQRGFSALDIGMRLTPDAAPNAARAARELTAFAVEDMSSDPRLDVGFVKGYGLKSVLTVPLVARGEVMGAALFYTSQQVRRFTGAELDFGRKLGAVVSLALENARLYGAEHRIAETLQQALLALPDTLPGIEFAPYYLSATESTLVGGDFYDVFEVDERRVGITIGDIAGKGLGAAVLTSLVRNTIRAHAFEERKSPALILSLTNDVVARSTPIESFATVFFAFLDRANGTLVYASAGHTTSTIVRRNHSLVEMTPTGPILGAFPGLAFSERRVRLHVRDVLFLYTDGLTEARREGELYGEERLFAHLKSASCESARGVAEQAVADVMAFANNHLRDDLAILALSRLAEETRATPADAEASATKSS